MAIVALLSPPPSVAKNTPLSVRRFRLLRADEEVLQRAIPFERLGQRRAPIFRQFVIAARRTLLALGDIVRLPARVAQPDLLEPAQRWINGAARQTGDVNDVEAVLIAVGYRLQDDRRRVTELDPVVQELPPPLCSDLLPSRRLLHRPIPSSQFVDWREQKGRKFREAATHLAELCKESKTCSALIWLQLCLLNAQEGQRSQVFILIPALDRMEQAFAQEAPHRQGRAGDFGGGQGESDIF